MDPHLLLKKPKLEEEPPVVGGDNRRETIVRGGEGDGRESISLQEQEEVLLDLIDHRTKEVQLNKQKAAYYRSQVEISEKKLTESHTKLARLRSPSSGVNPSKMGACNSGASAETRSSSPSRINGIPSREQAQPSRPQLVIPALNPKNVPTQGQGRTMKTDALRTEASAAGVSSVAKSSSSAQSSILERSW